jgi:large subunit ribosomal protein L22
MRTVATARFVRVSARKARLVLDQIRGRSVSEALATLQYTPRAAARLVEKVLRSAVANAEHNHQVRDLDALRVHHAIADGGPSLKRVQPRAMGRAFFIKHRTSHLSVGVSDEVNGAAPLAPPRHMQRPRRVAEPRPAPPRAAAEAAAPAQATAKPAKPSTRARAKKSPSAKGKSGRKSRG